MCTNHQPACNRVLRALAVVVVSTGLFSPLQAQFIQQGGKLLGTGAVGNSFQGYSVAISADGNTAVLGGYGDNGGIGAAWVYTNTGGVWSQQGAKLVGTGAIGGSQQGVSVALSADGNTAILGGYGDNGNAGAAWVFVRSGGVWSQQGGKLVGTGALPTTSQGGSVALSADGSTAIVGGFGDNNHVGAAWVYVRSGGVWSQQGGKLVGTGMAGGFADQGHSVALSADGNTALVGGRIDGDAVGAAWVYTRSGGAWAQQGGKLVGTDSAGAASQGESVALSADGNTAMVGGNFDNARAGAVWVYTRSGGVWAQQGSKLVGTGSALGESQQGKAVALSADGNTAVVGGYADDRGITGAAWAYARSGGVWNQLGSKLVGSGFVVTTDGVLQGYSVALSGDGRTAIVGGPGDNAYAGAAWTFAIPTPFIASGGVVNGASFLPPIAPGTWITIRGSNLSSTSRTWNGSGVSGSNLPTQLDGVSVSVNGKPAYIYYISPTQLNVLAPADAAQGTVAVQLTIGPARSNVVNVIESAVAPALFAFTEQGGKYVAAVRSDGAYLAPANLISGLATTPAKPGDTILLFGTGFGATTPPSPIGQLVNPAPLANGVTVQIGDVVVNTQFAGMVSPGLYQFNLVVPDVPNGDQRVSIGVGGNVSQPNVFLPVHQ